MLSSPLISLLLLRLPAAHAATLAVPNDKPDIGAALAIARPGDIIELDDDDPRWDAALATPLTVDINLTIRSDDADRVQIPGLSVADGATLTLQRVEVAGVYDARWTEDDSTYLSSTAAIFVHGGALRGEDILLPGVGDIGLLAIDADVELSALTATGFSVGRAVRSFNLQLPGRLSLSLCTMEDNSAGALSGQVSDLYGSQTSLEVSLTDCTFSHNSAELGADVSVSGATLSEDGTVHTDGVASSAGGAIWAINSDLSVANGTFSGSTAPYGAAVVARSDHDPANEARLDNVDLLNLEATRSGVPGGAACFINTHTVLEDLRAAGITGFDGAVLYQENGSFSASYLHISSFTMASGGGAIYLKRYYPPWNEAASVHHAVFCDGHGTAAQGMALRSDGYDTELTNSVFQSLSDAEGEAVYVSGAGALISQNTFTGNGLRYFVEGNVATLSATNNIFDHAESGVLLAESSSSITGSYNLWNDMQDYVEANGGVVTIIDAETVLAPPQIWVGFNPDDCYTDPYLAYGSPAIDAGDPTITDGDGTRSDIGAFGGPSVELPDKDADGWRIGEDCDDADERVNPGASETWYDGIDADCAGDDDYDADADGYPGGESGTDCDDQNPNAHPDQAETWYDGVDGDCDGQDDFDADGDGWRAEPLGGDCDDTNPLINPSMMELADDPIDRDCDGNLGSTVATLGGGCQGCASGGSPGGWLGLLGLALLRRRGANFRGDDGEGGACSGFDSF